MGEPPLSTSAVSRIVGRLKALFATWQTRSLSDDRDAGLFLDGLYLKVRLARRVVAVPVLAVTPTGEKRLVALHLAVSEATTAGRAVVADLQRRGLPAPRVAVTDGHAVKHQPSTAPAAWRRW